jgi:hypothetical protein
MGNRKMLARRLSVYFCLPIFLSPSFVCPSVVPVFIRVRLWPNLFPECPCHEQTARASNPVVWRHAHSIPYFVCFVDNSFGCKTECGRCDGVPDATQSVGTRNRASWRAIPRAMD